VCVDIVMNFVSYNQIPVKIYDSLKIWFTVNVVNTKLVTSNYAENMNK
jgi:hypothetical protein